MDVAHVRIPEPTAHVHNYRAGELTDAFPLLLNLHAGRQGFSTGPHAGGTKEKSADNGAGILLPPISRKKGGSNQHGSCRSGAGRVDQEDIGTPLWRSAEAHLIPLSACVNP